MSEEVCTIFVVGFPDDMKEREFQNMFTFSSGFVAARLTIPSADDIAEKDQKKTADKDQKKQTIGFAKFRTRADAIKARDVLTNRRVDADGVQVLKAELAKKDLYTWRTPFSLGLGTSKGATFGLDTPNTALGFQHKQQQPQTPVAQPQQPLQPLQPSQQQAQAQKPKLQLQSSQQQQQQGVLSQSGPRTAGISGSMMSSANRPEHLRISASRAFNPFNDAPLASAPILGSNSHRSFSASQFSSAFSNSSSIESSGSASVSQMSGAGGAMGGFMFSDQISNNLQAAGSHSSSGMMLHRRGSVHGTTPVSSSMGVSAGGGSVSSMYQQQLSMSEQGSSDSEMLQMTGQSHQLQLSPPLQAQTSAQQQPQPQMPQQSQKQMPQQPPKGYGSQRPALLDIAALQPRINQLSLGQMSASTLISPMGMPYTPSAKTPMGMVLPMATTRSVNTNDQNPPCNTLYVGNLPAGAMEEELRLIFQQALGFKRMSYRAKPCSGPMCFVEFDNIDFATLAMNELDGRMLSNSVGSGIRLSYSKNPLGVRSNQPGGAPPATPVLNSAAAAAVVAAMSGGYHHINGSPYGYSMAALQQQQHLQHQQQHLQRHNATPSPPGSAMMARNTSAMTLPQHQAVGGHRHSMSSSSAASPLPSPGTAMSSGDQTAVPKDALSFLHQPIHQLHKQASNDHPISSNGSPTPPQTSANSVNHIALEQ